MWKISLSYKYNIFEKNNKYNNFKSYVPIMWQTSVQAWISIHQKEFQLAEAGAGTVPLPSVML